MKRACLKTVGCRLNQAETALMAAQLEAAGYQIVPLGHPCDVAVVNSCAVTRKAESDSLRWVRSFKRSPRPPWVVLTGCVAEIDPERLRNESGSDMVVGQRDKFSLPEMLAVPAHSSGPSTPGTAREPEPLSGACTSAAHHISPRFDTTRALVRVQNGCNFCCTYCIVPSARGRPVSRPLAEILDEAEILARRGYREIVLTGANLGLYSDGPHRLIDLLTRIERIPGVDRIRLSSIEISTAERAVINFMASSRKLCHSLHLPLQSGDDRILAAMGRKYRTRDYRRTINDAIRKIPLLGLGTDILVGFPGEDSAAFDNTFALVQELPFSNIHVFPYSQRPGTEASRMPSQVPAEEKRRRVAIMIRLGHEKRALFASRFIGRKVSVLVEKLVAPGIGFGWTGEYLEAQVTSPDLYVNQIVDFEPSAFDSGQLLGV